VTSMRAVGSSDEHDVLTALKATVTAVPGAFPSGSTPGSAHPSAAPRTGPVAAQAPGAAPMHAPNAGPPATGFLRSTPLLQAWDALCAALPEPRLSRLERLAYIDVPSVSAQAWMFWDPQQKQARC
jgi:hypothetical protein